MEKSENFKAKLFFQKRKNIVRYCLLSFFTYKEKIYLANVSSCILKAVRESLSEWPEKLKELAESFSLDISNIDKELDKNIFSTIKNKRGFLIENTKGNYMQFDSENNFRYLALTSGESWAHSDNPSYWQRIKLPNSTFNGESYRLNNVCWLDLIINFHSVKPGVYDVYLRQTVEFNRNTIKENLSLKVIVCSLNGGSETKLYETKFMTEEMFQEVKNRSINKNKYKSYDESYLFEDPMDPNFLKDIYITTIDLTHFLFDEKLKVKIAFWHLNGYWKSGWIIDGAILHRKPPQAFQALHESQKILK